MESAIADVEYLIHYSPSFSTVLDGEGQAKGIGSAFIFMLREDSTLQLSSMSGKDLGLAEKVIHQ